MSDQLQDPTAPYPEDAFIDPVERIMWLIERYGFARADGQCLGIPSAAWHRRIRREIEAHDHRRADLLALLTNIVTGKREGSGALLREAIRAERWLEDHRLSVEATA